MENPTPKLLIICLLILLLTGCVKLALRVSPSLIPNLTEAFFEECDSDLARQSLPADLKLMEGLLKSDPWNRQILTSLCMGFAGYAMLFVEDDDPERASQFYLRSRAYGLRALSQNALLLTELGLEKKIIRATLLTFEEKELEALFWTSMSWNVWISLNLDRPAALAEQDVAMACLKRVLEIRPDYFYGAPHLILGSVLSAKPGFLGGDSDRAKAHFEKAMSLSGGTFLLVHYYFAKYYAVRAQDKGLFLELVREVAGAPAHELQKACLINTVIKQKMKRLNEMSEELFF